MFYVRPQVEFINSSWWQWGVWGNMPFEQWYKHRLRESKWDEMLVAMSALPVEHELHIGTCSENVVADFYAKLGVDPKPELLNARTNETLSTAAISFLLRNRKYRPTPHANKADVILEDFAPFKAAPKPWCLQPHLVEEVIERNRESNLRLLELVPAHVAEQIAADPHWWDPNAYADKRHWDWTDPGILAEGHNDADALRRLSEKGMA
ncbi:hypothetical protein AIOL_003795 [Candidatus Rhodobacter oscarellae]|uniref:Uncharacterized protein n=2 Tax=Candidatus Rhodobacter oscarellae TaxID=1675527 RepID=A0A0J9E7U7_9RHOB|nr:hypothetical protein AIOL_003795 [Candidatus Rhodobacter lobularis]